MTDHEGAGGPDKARRPMVSLKIALTVEALSPQLTGIGRYSWELAQRVGAIAPVEGLRFYRNGEWIADPATLLEPPPPRSRYPAIRWCKRRLRDYRRWQMRDIARSHLFHGPNYFLPEEGEGGVITVHDLSIYRYRETHPADRIAHFDRELHKSIDRAGHIITDTRTVRDEVIAHFGIDPGRITAIPLGVSPAFRPRPAHELLPVLDRHGLAPGGYALCVSTVEPRKRIAELLRAWETLPPVVRQRWPLMVTGGSGWLSDAVTDAMTRGTRAGWVRYLGYVDERDLPFLYAGAALFLYPSVYEGFGLPPVEAMASGVPTIVADTSCLPEVTQGEAMLVEPDDIDGFSQAIARALEDEPWRAQARARGIVVGQGYSWDRCARETVALYQKLVQCVPS